MKTKKKIFSIIILIFISKTVFAQSDEYKLTNINEEYIGTYIPVDLELRLYQSKKFYKSLYASRKYGKTKRTRTKINSMVKSVFFIYD